MSITKKERNKLRRDTLRSVGLCIHCGCTKSEEGRTGCRKCLDKIADIVRKRRHPHLATKKPWWSYLTDNE